MEDTSDTTETSRKVPCVVICLGVCIVIGLTALQVSGAWDAIVAQAGVDVRIERVEHGTNIHHSHPNVSSHQRFVPPEGSYSEFVLNRARHYKQVGSEYWNRSRLLIQQAQTVGVFIRDNQYLSGQAHMLHAMFARVGVNSELASENRTPPPFADDAVQVYFSCCTMPPNFDGRNAIVIQMEQLRSHWGPDIIQSLQVCKEETTCVVWDFSEGHVRILEEKGLGAVILPVTYLLAPAHTPDDIWDFPQRNFADAVMYGAGASNRRRVASLMKRIGLKRTIMGTQHNRDKLQFAYLNSKICFCIHAYGPNSAMEVMRMSEILQTGCLPLWENTPKDPLEQAFMSQHGVVFTSSDDMPTKAWEIYKEMRDVNSVWRERQLKHYQFWNHTIQDDMHNALRILMSYEN